MMIWGYIRNYHDDLGYIRKCYDALGKSPP